MTDSYFRFLIYESFESRKRRLEDDTPRNIFKCAMTDLDDIEVIEELNYGITDLRIMEQGRNAILITALIGKKETDRFEFDPEDRHGYYPQAIHFKINPMRRGFNEYGGLMEIENVGFYGCEESSQSYLLYTEKVPLGVFTLLERLFEIFPGFLNHVYISLSREEHEEILEMLGGSPTFIMLRELTVMKTMDINLWATLMEDLIRVKTFHFGKKANFEDFHNKYKHIKHMNLNNGNKLVSNDFASLHYETIKIANLIPDTRDIKLFMETWKDGNKSNLKYLSVEFKKPLSISDLSSLKTYLNGVKRTESPKKMIFKANNTVYSLENAYDIESPGCSGSYILTRKSFQFFVWKSFKNIIEPAF
ncbi:hypothetical protein GCK72_001764 [Caenorhabditis remanei]|uniref:F-box associated domain-containing protein n=1 Tax=Caenorhabditis remanei TaxID=31234 RepID=A0A6A5HUJ0_CAERE|nr:hypothetical protein GCK72_001764 [Caenorhabditis remanei]KAF1769947.1 hypothetical protein GCK72_001764 [Caenorhabditis remanei]